MRCLLVDDEPGIREGLATLLRRRGHEVRTAGDCAGAAAALAGEAFDVVVTDWRLPDGLAGRFVAQCTSPVVAVSGHPDEVERIGAVCAVLPKPVTPARLLDAIAAAGALPPPVDEPERPLSRDAQAVVDDVMAQLPVDADVELFDDGAFAVLRAVLPERHVPTVRNLGGDLRSLPGDARRVLELRVCRDGRPDPATPVVRIDGPWPDGGGFALDCGGVDVPPARFAQWLDLAGRLSAAGRDVVVINVPEPLEGVTSGWEATHELPMRGRVGPRLPAELTELWS